MLQLVKINSGYIASLMAYRDSFKYDKTIPGAHLLKRWDIGEWVALQEELEIDNPKETTRPKQICRLLVDSADPIEILGIITHRIWREDNHLSVINGNLKFSIAPVLRGTGLSTKLIWLFAHELDKKNIQYSTAVIENDNIPAQRLLESFDAEVINKIYTGMDYCTAYKLSTQNILSVHFEL